MNIENLIIDLSRNPFNPVLNFDAAVEYERLNQTASAVSFYLRAAEYGPTSNDERVYAALLKVAHCFDNQNDRQATVTNCLFQAIAYWPERPEAWFLLSQFNERISAWQEAYTFALAGLACKEFPALPIAVGYEGKYCLLFEKAISAYWIGRKEESLSLLRTLLTMDISSGYRTAIEENLRRLDAAV